MSARPILSIEPLSPADIPDPSTPAFESFLQSYISAADTLIETLPSWKSAGTHDGVPTHSAPPKSDAVDQSLPWVGRISKHVLEFKASNSRSTFERFREGLLVDHTIHEKEYIESLFEVELLETYVKGVAEVWRATYKTPPPTNPRTFTFLILTPPSTDTSFLVITIPFSHPSCPPKAGSESNRVRARYVSVERITQTIAPALDEGADSDAGGSTGEIEWRMATASIVGGWIPQWITNKSLPSKISEDVPSLLKWLDERS